MFEPPIVLNEREARRVRSALSRIDDTLSPNAVLETARVGLPTDVVELHRNAIRATRGLLDRTLAAYEKARTGEYADLLSAWRSDPGVVLVIARIARRMSQADLAHALGMKEQQIQRYEAERYRSISLQNYRRIAAVLGVELHAEIVNANDAWLRQITVPESPQFSERQTKAIMQHAKQRSWFEVPTSADEQQALLRDFINESNARLASPALLRTGLRTVDLKEDVALAAWRARVVQQAEAMSAAIDNQFDPLDISWVRDLIQSSVHSDGPVRAQNMLRDKGIAVVVEPQITGLRLDGAAFLVNGLPVIALTIRNDRVDNFWFTLLHELGHIFLHQQEGLVAGFFDEEIDSEKTDELELQANQFAGSILIPSERWRMSPARISKSPAPIEEFARQLGIHPAIVFGRVRKERGDYSLFADRLGSGQVRSQLLR